MECHKSIRFLPGTAFKGSPFWNIFALSWACRWSCSGSHGLEFALRLDRVEVELKTELFPVGLEFLNFSMAGWLWLESPISFWESSGNSQIWLCGNLGKFRSVVFVQVDSESWESLWQIWSVDSIVMYLMAWFILFRPWVILNMSLMYHFVGFTSKNQN